MTKNTNKNTFGFHLSDVSSNETHIMKVNSPALAISEYVSSFAYKSVLGESKITTPSGITFDSSNDSAVITFEKRQNLTATKHI